MRAKLHDGVLIRNELILDKDKFDPTVDFFFEKFKKLKVSVFRYEFEPESKNDVFEHYYFYTYKIMDKVGSAKYFNSYSQSDIPSVDLNATEVSAKLAQPSAKMTYSKREIVTQSQNGLWRFI